MRGAGAADALHLLAQFAAGAEQAHIERVHTLIRRLRDLGGGFAAEVDAAQQLSIRLRQCGEELHHTLAECFFVFRLQCLRQLMHELFQSLISRGTAAMRVDDGMTQHTIEPSDDAFSILGHVVGLQRLHEAFLDEISGEFGITGAGTGETDEGIEMLEERSGGHGAGSRIQDTHRHAANQRVTSLHLVRGHRMKGHAGSTSHHHPFTP